MKVLLVNGSPHKNGCTYTALSEVAKPWSRTASRRRFSTSAQSPCVAVSPAVPVESWDTASSPTIPPMSFPKKCRPQTAIVIGSPVYYAGPNGALCALLDRVFYSGSGFAFKPAAAVVSARRSGTTATFDRLNKYFTINQMPVVSSQYWNGVHGHCPEDVMQDLEGLQTMRTLGHNMAWMLKNIAAGGQAHPEPEDRVATNFIR